MSGKTEVTIPLFGRLRHSRGSWGLRGGIALVSLSNISSMCAMELDNEVWRVRTIFHVPVARQFHKRLLSWWCRFGERFHPCSGRDFRREVDGFNRWSLREEVRLRIMMRQ
jgi:hypothetical protein